MRYWTFYSGFLAILLGVLSWKYCLLSSLDDGDVPTLVITFSQISATLLGFLIAALSILASISGHRLLREMQRTGHYRVLLRRLFINCAAFAFAMSVSLVALVFKKHFALSLGSLVSFVFACLLLVDIGWRLWLVLHNLTPEQDSNS